MAYAIAGVLKKRIEKQLERITAIQNRLYGEAKQALLAMPKCP